MREHRGRHERRILELHLMVDLVALAQSAEDRDRVLDGRLADEHRLEAPLERRVLLDVLAYSSSVVAPIVCSSPRASIGLSICDASIAPSAAPAPTTVCSSSMNRTIRPRFRDLLEDGFQPLLELAARAPATSAHVEREDLLVLQAFRHVAADDPLRQSFDDGRLADAGFADEDRVVLGAARQDLDDAAHFLVAADHRIELARREPSVRSRP